MKRLLMIFWGVRERKDDIYGTVPLNNKLSPFTHITVSIMRVPVLYLTGIDIGALIIVRIGVYKSMFCSGVCNETTNE